MNKYTEQQIENQLKRLASIEPGDDSVRQMNQRVRSIISGIDKKPTAFHGFFYYAAASAAILLIGIGLLYNSNRIEIQPKTVWTMPTKPTLALVHLNAVLQNGNLNALDEYFEKVELNRQPRAETITLQEIMKDL